ncbi:MAG: winged helix DNA-binding domain-containing protein [Nitriliruptorales bacterium]|nr:winged helix DNA-binding domain-containing protein [Nitriliruptorales bacterium]
MGPDERRRRLALRHSLGGTRHGTDVASLVVRMIGLHASDPATVHLSARARVPMLELTDMESALYEERNLVRVLGMRRTLFVVAVDDAPLLQHGCAGPLAARERQRLVKLIEESGIATDGGRWLARIEAATIAALEERGLATASELTQDVPELGEKIVYSPDKPYGGAFGVVTRVLFLLATDSRIVRGRPRGGWTSSLYQWAPLSSWAPAADRQVAMDDARRALAERWLRTFGPAPVADLEWWSGWGKRAVARALAALDIAAVDLEEGDGVALADDLEPTPMPQPWAALLPGLDPTVMGWKHRAWFLGDHHDALFDRNGNAGPTVWWNGRVVGGWTQRPDGQVVHRLLEDVGSEASAAIESRAAELEGWLGERRFVSRFRTPLERDLFESGS